MGKNTEVDLKLAFMATGIAIPLSSSSKGGHVEVTLRVVPGQEKTWLQAVESVLNTVADDLHFCKRFIVKDGKLCQGWHFSVDRPTKSLGQVVKTIIAELSKVKPSEDDVGEDDPVQSQVYRRPLPPGAHPAREARKIPPGPPGRSDGTPSGGISITVTESRVDESGKQYIVKEMPLPHVRGEMNVPNHLGRGAVRTAGSR